MIGECKGLITIRTLIYVTHNISASVPKVSTINAISVYSIICITFIVCSLSQLGYVSRILHGGTKTIELKRLDTREVLKATIQRPLSSPVLGNLKSPSLTQVRLEHSPIAITHGKEAKGKRFEPSIG